MRYIHNHTRKQPKVYVRVTLTMSATATAASLAPKVRMRVPITRPPLERKKKTNKRCFHHRVASEDRILTRFFFFPECDLVYGKTTCSVCELHADTFTSPPFPLVRIQTGCVSPLHQGHLLFPCRPPGQAQGARQCDPNSPFFFIFFFFKSCQLWTSFFNRIAGRRGCEEEHGRASPLSPPSSSSVDCTDS